MKKHTLLQSFGILAISGLLAAGPAQAGMGSCLAGAARAPSPACAGGQTTRQACPVPDENANRGDACAAGNQEMMNAVGSLAAGGIGIAAQVMRTLLEEANRYLAPSQGL